MTVLLAILVTCTMMVLDYCHARYTRAMMAGEGLKASFWSVGQWSAASVGFVVAVKVSMWYLPFEALGLFLGTYIGARKLKPATTIPEARLVCTEKKAERSVPHVSEK
jgi:hypothetical protein